MPCVQKRTNRFKKPLSSRSRTSVMWISSRLLLGRAYETRGCHGRTVGPAPRVATKFPRVASCAMVVYSHRRGREHLPRPASRASDSSLVVTGLWVFFRSLSHRDGAGGNSYLYYRVTLH